MPGGGRALPWGLWQHKPFPWHWIRFHVSTPCSRHSHLALPTLLSTPQLSLNFRKGNFNSGYVRGAEVN